MVITTMASAAGAPSRSRPGPVEVGRVGVWFVGARGSVATTATLGMHALSAGLVPPVGISTATPAFDSVPLPEFDDLLIGGHDVSSEPLTKRAEGLAEAGLFPARLVDALADRLRDTDAQLRPVPHERCQQDEIDARATDIEDFARRHTLDRVVVVDVSSTEPLPADREEFHDDPGLVAALAVPGAVVLPPSSLAAAAAVAAGAGYVCFTPSAGMNLPVLRARAQAAGLPFAGQDGKTGETLLRSVLAPMFTGRALQVHSWAGSNLLGGGDGATLANPEAVDSKLASKSRGLQAILGDDVVAPLHIDNVPDLGEVKTAWDHVHASGFLGSRIVLQTIWSAYDSALAAPLVIDLVRLTALAHAAGEAGPLAAVASYFKDPWGSDTHGYAEQRADLLSWARRFAAQPGWDRR